MTFNFTATDHPSLGYVFLAWLAVWLITLGVILNRRDFDAITRLTWVVVVIFVPVFGILLYVFFSPERLSSNKPDYRDELYGTPWKNDPGHTGSKATQET